MSDAPRRRRSEEDSGGGGGGLPLFPLILVVIFAGLLLGGVLAKFFGATPSPKSTPPPVTFTISPDSSMAPLAMATRKSPAPIPTPTLSAAAKPPARLTEKPSPVPSVSPLATPTEAPAPKETPKPVATAHVVYVTPAPHRGTEAPNNVFTPSAGAPQEASAATTAPNYVAAGPDQAAAIVRSYLGALARGDRATATSYLAHGLPNEGFMDANSRILSIHPESSASPYKVSADVQTSTGEYYITFTLQQGTGGLQIVDHYAIKPQ